VIDAKDVVLLFAEDFASSAAPAAKKTKSDSKGQGQVKDGSRKNEKENSSNSSNCENKPVECSRCLFFLLLLLCSCFLNLLPVYETLIMVVWDNEVFCQTVVKSNSVSE